MLSGGGRRRQAGLLFEDGRMVAAVRSWLQDGREGGGGGGVACE